MLERRYKVCNLGTLLDHKLTFHDYYLNTVNKANKMIGFLIRQANEFTDPVCLKAIYAAIVRPKLEFNSVTWNPSSRVWIHTIESVPRCFKRLVLRHLRWRGEMPDYHSRCLLLGLSTLEKTREVVQCSFVVKIVRGECRAHESVFRSSSLRQAQYTPT